MDIGLFSSQGAYFLAKWTHFLAGITWIGILYYFNFVQGSFFKETDANTKGAATRQLVPRALWWFRWGAMFTFLSGAYMLFHMGHGAYVETFTSPWGVKILVGSLLGTLMFLNVWLIIWPNQKIVIRSAEQSAAGGAAIPEAASAAAKAALASRTNVLFSIGMLFFMGAARNLPSGFPEGSLWTFWIPVLIIIGALEFNGIKGKMGPMASVKGVIVSGFVLTAVLYGLLEVLL